MDIITSWIFKPHGFLPITTIIGKGKSETGLLQELIEGASIFIDLANAHKVKFVLLDDNICCEIREGEMAISFCMIFPNNEALDNFLDEVDEYLN